MSNLFDNQNRLGGLSKPNSSGAGSFGFGINNTRSNGVGQYSFGLNNPGSKRTGTHGLGASSSDTNQFNPARQQFNPGKFDFGLNSGKSGFSALPGLGANTSQYDRLKSGPQYSSLISDYKQAPTPSPASTGVQQIAPEAKSTIDQYMETSPFGRHRHPPDSGLFQRAGRDLAGMNEFIGENITKPYVGFVANNLGAIGRYLYGKPEPSAPPKFALSTEQADKIRGPKTETELQYEKMNPSQQLRFDSEWDRGESLGAGLPVPKTTGFGAEPSQGLPVPKGSGMNAGPYQGLPQQNLGAGLGGFNTRGYNRFGYHRSDPMSALSNEQIANMAMRKELMNEQDLIQSYRDDHNFEQYGVVPSGNALPLPNQGLQDYYGQQKLDQNQQTLGIQAKLADSRVLNSLGQKFEPAFKPDFISGLEWDDPIAEQIAVNIPKPVWNQFSLDIARSGNNQQAASIVQKFMQRTGLSGDAVQSLLRRGQF